MISSIQGVYSLSIRDTAILERHRFLDEKMPNLLLLKSLPKVQLREDNIVYQYKMKV